MYLVNSLFKPYFVIQLNHYLNSTRKSVKHSIIRGKQSVFGTSRQISAVLGVRRDLETSMLSWRPMFFLVSWRYPGVFYQCHLKLIWKPRSI